MNLPNDTDVRKRGSFQTDPYAQPSSVIEEVVSSDEEILATLGYKQEVYLDNKPLIL